MKIGTKDSKKKTTRAIRYLFVVFSILSVPSIQSAHEYQSASSESSQSRIQKFREDLKPFSEQMEKGNFGAAYGSLTTHHENGNYLASLEMALFHLRGFGAKLDKKKADILCNQTLAFALSDISHSTNAEDFDTLGQIYREGCGVTEDENEALNWQNKAIALYTKQATAGDVYSMNRLGGLYTMQKNGELSNYWYQQSANAGVPHAAFVLGLLYQGGPFSLIKHDLEKAKIWFAKAYELSLSAAQKGVATEQSKVGLFYSKGLVVEKDTNKAIEWYELAANAGVLSAQAPLANLYFERQEYALARKWFEAAAKQWDADSIYQLAQMVRDGIGGEKSHTEYVNLLKLAAEQDSYKAQDELKALLDKN